MLAASCLYRMLRVFFFFFFCFYGVMFAMVVMLVVQLTFDTTWEELKYHFKGAGGTIECPDCSVRPQVTMRCDLQCRIDRGDQSRNSLQSIG